MASLFDAISRAPAPLSSLARALAVEGRVACARALAFAAGLSVALAAIGRDLSWLWLDACAPPLRWAALVALAAAALWVSRPRASRRANVVARLALLTVAVLAAVDVARCWEAAHTGRLYALTPMPFSAVVAGLSILLAVTRAREPTGAGALFGSGLSRGLLAVSALALLLGAQIAGVAFTDYRRPADAIVVLGAGVHADGSPSEALEQRMATACELYARGYAPLVIVSGGRGKQGPPEPDVMRTMALGCGVPDRAILRDEEGVDTEATAVNTARIARRAPLRTVIAVSHGYHLARVGLALRRSGVRAVTVPARERRSLRAKPYYLARELAAYALYAIGVTPA